MQLVKLTTERIPNLFKVLTCLLSIAYCEFAQAQDNSPYSRYGIGDLVPSTNIVNRGMGRITAGFNNFLSINFSNPASYTSFQAMKEARSTRLQSGRTLFDIGVNYDSRTLREPDNPTKFRAQNLLFSYMQVGMPLRSNWGFTFGLRPVSRISYKIQQREFIDTIGENVATIYTGDGGSYLPNIGTAVRIGNLSIGVNAGYLFGKKDYSTRRGFENDTVDFNPSNHETRTVFGNIFLQGGLQYRNRFNDKNKTLLIVGVSGNLGTTLNARQDEIVETFVRDPSLGDLRLDSVYEQIDVKGEMEYPGSFTVGFTVGPDPSHQDNLRRSNWLLGIDFTSTAWADYRYYGLADFTQDTWELKVGGHFRPAPKSGYFSNVTYRAGFFIGPDYINTGKKLPQFGATFGMGLPIANYNRLAQTQATMINLAFEYNRRGNNANVLKEDVYRLSLGLSLSDLWFIKRKYE